MDVVIIGDGVAGHTAAETLREESDCAITVITQESVPFYDRIGLRDYIRGGRDRDALVLKDAAWYGDQGIDLHLDTHVERIDREEQRVETDSGTITYDALLLATGSTPRTLPMEADVSRAHHLWELDAHGDPFKAHLEQAEHAVAIGGGLLGFDLIGAFVEADVEPHYLIREEHWWSRVLDDRGASIVHDAMQQHGVHLHTETEAHDMQQDGEVVTVQTDDRSVETDVVGIAVGNTRNVELAAAAGLDTDNGIIADATLQTSDPSIYAAGDCAAYEDVVLEQRHRTGSWVSAQAQGERAAKNMLGADEPLRFVDQYTVAHFRTNVASLGDPAAAGEVIVAQDDDRYRKVVVQDGRIVGAAIIGEMRWLHPLQQLILNKVDVAGVQEQLADPDMDLADIV